MVKKFSPEQDNLIRSQWYQGLPRPEIERQADASAGHISDIVAEEKRLVGEGNVDTLRRLAIEVGKKGHTPVDIMRAIRFLNACNGLGMDDEKVIGCLPRVDEACKRGGIGIEGLPVDIESRLAKARELDARIQESERIAAEAEKHREEALRRAGQTDESLAKCQETRDFLASHGLVADSPERLKNALLNAEEANYDMEAIVAGISENESLRRGNASLATENAEIERRKAENAKVVGQQKSEMARNAEVLGKLHELERKGLGLPELTVIATTVSDVAVKNGMDGSTAVKKFIDDLKSTDYDRKAGFAVKADRLQKLCEEREAMHDQLKMEYAADKQAIQSLRVLYSRGVKNHEVVALKNIVVKSGASTTAELEDDITMYGTIKNANKEHEKRNKEVQTENLALEKRNELLKRENEALKKAGEEFRASFKKDTEEMTGTVKASREVLESATAGATQTVQKAVTDMEEKVKTFGTKIEGLSDTATRETDKIKKNQSLLRYDVLVRAEQGEPVSKAAAIASLVLAILAVRPMLTGVWLGDAGDHLDIVVDKMKYALKSGMIS
ncbi:hypothetical protein [Candidatus Nitrososphaera evergladensis]|nr:hypothetical protein [Candidatus Nitrososphaera evergladensis]